MPLINPNKTFDPLVIILLIIAGAGILSVIFGAWNVAREKTIENQYEDNQKMVSPASTKTIGGNQQNNDLAEREREEETGSQAKDDGKIESVEDLDSEPFIIERFISWGYRRYSGSREVDAIVIHSAYDALGGDPYSVDGVIEEFRTYKVASHYLIDREGNIYQLVSDDDIAYHAGAGVMPDGRTGINNFSIGIEMIYRETESPNETQYQALTKLTKYKAAAYNISLDNIVGHTEIDPIRKTDPWNFEWDRFEGMIK